MVALLVIVTILMFLTFDYFVQRAEALKLAGTMVRETTPTPAWAMPAVEALPRGLFVGPGHSWAALQPTGSMRIGADKLPTMLMGKIETIELPPVGREIHRGEPVAKLHAAGRTLVLEAAADGVVEAVNSQASADPALLGRDPYGQGWLYQMAPRQVSSALHSLLIGDEAAAWMRRELRRVRDFLGTLPMRQELAGATMQDGGLPVNGVAGSLDDESWALLQQSFFSARVPE